MNDSYFDVGYWNNSTIYYKHNISYVTGAFGIPTYYYCLVDNNQGDNPIASSQWTKSFIWTPSYSTNSEMMFSTVSTETNFPKRSPQGVNNELLRTNLFFENRTESEAKAISHFVNTKRGVDSFQYTHNLFDGTGLYFIASAAEVEYVYSNLYNITVSLEQVAL